MAKKGTNHEPLLYHTMYSVTTSKIPACYLHSNLKLDINVKCKAVCEAPIINLNNKKYIIKHVKFYMLVQAPADSIISAIPSSARDVSVCWQSIKGPSSGVILFKVDLIINRGVQERVAVMARRRCVKGNQFSRQQVSKELYKEVSWKC